MPSPEELARDLRIRATDGQRLIVAVAGPPGAGKSTVTEALVATLNAAEPSAPPAICVPMDGFHFDNAILDAQGLRHRKGAPETFDAAGYIHLVRRLRNEGGPIAIPLFDRAADLSRAAADVVMPHHRFVVTEGNYLLLGIEPWNELSALFDVTLWLEVDDAVLEDRLMKRWLSHGLDREQAMERASGNDLPNARYVKSHSRPAQIVLQG